jgi:hypothetical protein
MRAMIRPWLGQLQLRLEELVLLNGKREQMSYYHMLHGRVVELDVGHTHWWSLFVNSCTKSNLRVEEAMAHSSNSKRIMRVILFVQK